VIYYDEHLAVIDKPPNLVVHPAPSVKGLTLCHGLLKDFPQVKNVGSAPSVEVKPILESVLSNRNRPTAIFCFCDSIALEVIKVLKV